jgi:CheY-like chemotaxis protein
MILLIDDSDQERAIIRKMLESAGYQVHEAGGGGEALSQFGTLAPSLVLCDLMMPFKDGFATVAEMQALVPDAKIIAMSGVWYGEADHEGMAENLGLVAVIEKPFSRAQLLDLVSRTLNPEAKPPRPKGTTKAKAKAKPRPKTKAKPKRRAAAKSTGRPKAKSRRIAKKTKKKRR